MNILVVSHYGLYQDFSSSFVHAQARAYVGLGHRVRVLVLMPVGKRDWDGRRFSGSFQRREEGGLTVCRLRFLSLSNPGKRHFNTPSAICALSAHLGRTLDGFAPDVIHAHALGISSGVGAWLKNRLGVPLVVTTHGETLCDEMWMRDPARGKLIASKGNRLVCVSSLLKRQLDEIGVPVPMSVILNGFRVHNLPKSKTARTVTLAQVGALDRQKRPHITLRAFARLLEAHPEMTLTLIGHGPERSSLETESRELGISESVRFLGQIPNAVVLEELAKTRFFVLPSFREGFGIVYLEAMASGCVTIGTEGEGIADLIVSGENGFLIPPDDPEAIVQTIEWCLAHPCEASAIAERGRKDALGLTWEKNAGQYIQLFESLTGRKRNL